jgi:histidinol-phosphate phosphatase family protein
LRPAVFLDKDGTLVENVPYNVDPERLRFTRGAPAALQRLQRAGYALVVVSNQSGVARGLFDAAALDALLAALKQRLRDEAGVELTDVLVCPHAPDAGCACRKPSPGLIEAAARKHALDLGRSWMVGDILDDVEAGRRAGCRTVLIEPGGETLWRRSPWRIPHHRCADLSQAAQHVLAHDASAATAVTHEQQTR